MKVNNREVGARIKGIRLTKGMTLEEFGKLFGASKGSVQGWESGRNLPNPERLKSLAKIGDTTVEELLYGSLENQVRSMIIKHLEFNNRPVIEEYLERAVRYAKDNSIYPKTEDDLVLLITAYDHWYRTDNTVNKWRIKYLVDRLSDGEEVQPALSNLLKLMSDLRLTLGDGTMQLLYRYNIDNPDKNILTAAELRDFLIKKRSEILDIDEEADPLGLYASQVKELTDVIQQIDLLPKT